MGPQGKPQAVNCTGGTAPLSSGKGGFGGNKGGFGGEFGKGGGKGSYGGKGGFGSGGDGSQPVCRQFQQGNCSYGDRCRFAHI